MTVFVDDVSIPFRGMLMCHCWSDVDEEELLDFVDKIGVQRRWIQKPPKASWVHFDISAGKKAIALRLGAVLTDKYGPSEHVARLRGDHVQLQRILTARAVSDTPPNPQGLLL